MMKCKVCGREMSGKSNVCYACGAKQQRDRVKFGSPLGVLRSEVAVGKKIWHVWSLCIAVLVCMGLLAAIAAVGPMVGKFIGDKKQELEDAIAPPPVQSNTVSEIEAVSGVIVEIDGVFSSQTPIEEHAYDDGTWQYVELVDERITIRYNRFLPSDSWVAEHIFKLYPDVLEVEEFSDKAVVSGYSSPRIQISSTASAEGCVVEVMLIKTAEYDYVTAIEVPTDIFYDYEFQIDEWYRAQRLVDVQTGLEVINPDAQVSATDENAGDVTTTAVQ